MTVRLAVNAADVAAVSIGAGTVIDALPAVAAGLSIVWLTIRIGEWLWRTVKRMRT